MRCSRFALVSISVVIAMVRNGGAERKRQRERKERAGRNGEKAREEQEKPPFIILQLLAHAVCTRNYSFTTSHFVRRFCDWFHWFGVHSLSSVALSAERINRAVSSLLIGSMVSLFSFAETIDFMVAVGPRIHYCAHTHTHAHTRFTLTLSDARFMCCWARRLLTW